MFNVTFEIVTEESAEHGDAAERGFIAENVSLRDAIEYLGTGNYVEADSWPISAQFPPRWITAYEVNDGTREWYETDRHEHRSIHFPDSISGYTAMRIARLLNCHGA